MSAEGKLNTVINEAREGLRLQKIMNEITLKNTKLTEEQLTNMIAGQDYYMDPQTAMQYGFIDYIEPLAAGN